MAQPIWTRLDREQTNKVLDQLGSRGDAVVFSRDVTEVSWRGLNFYEHYRLYRVTNYATMPTFSMTYLSNDEEFFPIDGTSHPIYTVNEKAPIRLSEINIVSYLDFFFSTVHGSEGDIFLIKDPRKMPFMDTLNQAQQQSILSSFKPFKVTADSLGGFGVTGTFHYAGSLVMATISVSAQGKMSFHDQSLLLSGIHFPESPYTQAWMEGQSA